MVKLQNASMPFDMRFAFDQGSSFLDADMFVIMGSVKGQSKASPSAVARAAVMKRWVKRRKTGTLSAVETKREGRKKINNGADNQCANERNTNRGESLPSTGPSSRHHRYLVPAIFRINNRHLCGFSRGVQLDEPLRLVDRHPPRMSVLQDGA